MGFVTVFFLTLVLTFNAWGLEISDNLKVFTTVKPDTFVLPLKVEVRAKYESEVVNTLGAIDSLVRSLNFKYEGGIYTVEELREWDSNLKKYIKKGFKGTISYRFFLKKPEEQSKILNTIENYKSKKSFIYSIESPHWEISPNKREYVLEELKRNLIETAKREAQIFSDTLDKNCKLESITFRPYYYYNRFFPNKRNVGIPPIPTRSDREIFLEANVKFRCK